jgi:hypothetical protein
MRANCCAWPDSRAVPGLPAPAAGPRRRLGLIGGAGLAGWLSIRLRAEQFARIARLCLPPPAAWTAARAAPLNSGWLSCLWARRLVAAVPYQISAGLLVRTCGTGPAGPYLRDPANRGPAGGNTAALEYVSLNSSDRK